MRTKLTLIASALVLGGVRSYCQGTVFVYDQQSSTETNVLEGGYGIQSSQPFGQSFTPSLSTVGFIRLDLFSDNVANGASMDILLHANSILGPVIGTSEMVSLPGNFSGFVNFYFDMPVSVTPETTYYFQPIVQPGGDNVGTFASISYNYPGGGAIYQGTLYPTTDLWFREGIVVPEPSTWALLVLGAGALLWFRRR